MFSMIKVLFWNARGARSDDFFYAVANIVKINSVDILAICEPCVQIQKSRDSLLRIGFSDFEVVEAIGFSGGIWLLWNKSKVSVSIIDKNSQSISVKVNIPGKFC